MGCADGRTQLQESRNFRPTASCSFITPQGAPGARFWWDRASRAISDSLCPLAESRHVLQRERTKRARLSEGTRWVLPLCAHMLPLMPGCVPQDCTGVARYKPRNPICKDAAPIVHSEVAASHIWWVSLTAQGEERQETREASRHAPSFIPQPVSALSLS
ncbi:hypothetical protein L1887_55491 [Cichorium endivia]|nr:hypothetical protein L1887_55491 [Cichorium endivia]